MVRTSLGVRVSGGKSSKKGGGSSRGESRSFHPAAGQSSSSGSRLPPIPHTETPSWQKPITQFFNANQSKNKGVFITEQQTSETETNVASSSKTDNIEPGTSAIVNDDAKDIEDKSGNGEGSLDNKDKEVETLVKSGSTECDGILRETTDKTNITKPKSQITNIHDPVETVGTTESVTDNKVSKTKKDSAQNKEIKSKSDEDCSDENMEQTGQPSAKLIKLA